MSNGRWGHPDQWQGRDSAIREEALSARIKELQAEVERLRERHERDLVQVREAHEARRLAEAKVERLRAVLDTIAMRAEMADEYPDVEAAFRRAGEFARQVLASDITALPTEAERATPGVSDGSDVMSGPAMLVREVSVLWQYDGPGGYQWRANRDGKRAGGRADTADEAWKAACAWEALSDG